MTVFAQRVVFNGFWLLVPVFVWNAVFMAKLPPAFSGAVFWREIPAYIALPENLLRIAAFALPCVTVIGGFSTHRPGYFFFGLGLVVYFSSWLGLICFPQKTWSRSAVGFMAPAYTPCLWLSGIALITDSYVGHERSVRWALLAFAAGFMAFHVAHVALVYRREHHRPPAEAKAQASV